MHRLPRGGRDAASSGAGRAVAVRGWRGDAGHNGQKMLIQLRAARPRSGMS